jgi:hypothetical protein
MAGIERDVKPAVQRLPTVVIARLRAFQIKLV